jgi:hypothetical protein
MTIADPRPAGTVHVTVEATRPRPTPVGVSRGFREALGATGQSLLRGIEEASALVPGGAAVSAAVRGTSSALRDGEGSVPSGAAEAVSLSDLASQNLYYLQLQEQISAENRRYTALSNVMKARHETAKNAVNNIR